MIMMLERDRFISYMAGTSTLAPWAAPAPSSTTGHLQLMILTTLTTWVLIRLTSIRPPAIGVSTVSPSVVLLDNHTTNRYKKYGWKWENAPTNRFQGFNANYLRLNNHDLRLAPTYFLFGGRVDTGSLYDAGAFGHDWSSTVIHGASAYHLLLDSTSVYPSYYTYRYVGYFIRCLAR